MVETRLSELSRWVRFRRILSLSARMIGRSRVVSVWPGWTVESGSTDCGGEEEAEHCPVEQPPSSLTTPTPAGGGSWGDDLLSHPVTRWPEYCGGKTTTLGGKMSSMGRVARVEASLEPTVGLRAAEVTAGSDRWMDVGRSGDGDGTGAAGV